jgi:hypothetical protein
MHLHASVRYTTRNPIHVVLLLNRSANISAIHSRRLRGLLYSRQKLLNRIGDCSVCLTVC